MACTTRLREAAHRVVNALVPAAPATLLLPTTDARPLSTLPTASAGRAGFITCSPSRPFSSIASKAETIRGAGAFRTMSSINDAYKFKDLLGQGAFAEVWRVEDKDTGVEYACKSINKETLHQASQGHMLVSNEIENHLTVTSMQEQAKGAEADNVVHFHCAIEDRYAIHLLMDVCEGGDLFNEVMAHDLDEDTVRNVMRVVAAAVGHCHDNSIAHRDIKPENFAFGDAGKDASSLKLLDFGLSRSFRGGKGIQKRAGSPYYVAPEVLTNRTYDQNCDAWSVGVLAYFAMTGKVPFGGSSRRKVFDKITQGHYCTAMLESASEGAQDFISRLLVVDPRSRMSVEEAMNHAWLKEEGHGAAA